MRGLGRPCIAALTREPGDLPASGRSCLGPGDGHGPETFRPSDERAVKAASVRADGRPRRPAVGACRPLLAAGFYSWSLVLLLSSLGPWRFEDSKYTIFISCVCLSILRAQT